MESPVLADYGENWILVHPDMTSHNVLARDGVSVTLEDSFRVVPTASSRTVQVLSATASDYIKLHYDGILGRVYRALPFQKAIAGIEITRDLEVAFSKGDLSQAIAFFPETGTRYMQVPGAPEGSGIGMIWRRNRLAGSRAAMCKHVWPLFSLFSTDRLAPLDDPLLVQLIALSGQDPEQYLLENLLFPLVDFYFDLAVGRGLQIECNAQNVMVGLDDAFHIVVIAVRDLMRCEKDLPIRRRLGLSTDFDSAPYKCIDDGDDLYAIRHSFSFDFKFSHYLAKPLVGAVVEHFGCDSERLVHSLREYVLSHVDRLPMGYFPSKRSWFKHDRILLTGERPYVECHDPLLR
jgi:siderophore synthetase component